MAHSTTPHTQTQQNREPEQTDLEPDQLKQEVGRGKDSDLYREREGAQTGTNRGPEFIPNLRGNPNSEPAAAALEGSTTTRTPGGKEQGITSHSAEEESRRQEKVVKDRPDADAGVNHNR
jgi:hypothetical protein